MSEKKFNKILEKLEKQIEGNEVTGELLEKLKEKIEKAEKHIKNLKEKKHE